MKKKLILGFICIFTFCFSAASCSKQLRIVIIDKNGKETILLSESEIESYDWEKHEIFIKQKYKETLIDKEIMEGDTFIVYIGQMLIASGNFINAAYSSFDISKPIIYFGADNRLFLSESFSFKIRCINCKEEENPLNNNNLYKYLKKKKLLKE